MLQEYWFYIISYYLVVFRISVLQFAGSTNDNSTKRGRRIDEYGIEEDIIAFKRKAIVVYQRFTKRHRIKTDEDKPIWITKKERIRGED